MRLQLSDMPAGPDELPIFAFDFQHIRGDASDVAFDALPEWLDQAHQRIKDAFEASLSESLKQTFDEEPA